MSELIQTPAPLLEFQRLVLVSLSSIRAECLVENLSKLVKSNAINQKVGFDDT